MQYPFRQLLPACTHSDTYKYFIDPQQVDALWAKLKEHYGPIRTVRGLATIEIESEALLLRAPESGNPITVIRKRRCSTEDVEVLHHLIHFTGVSE